MTIANYGDIDTEGQMRKAVDLMHINDMYEFNDETVSAFLSRVGISDPRNYTEEVLTGYLFNVLDTVFDNRLSFLNKLQKLQQSLTDIFFNFNSYTVQLINNYYSGGDLLGGPKIIRCGVKNQSAYELDALYANNTIIITSEYDRDSYSAYKHDIYLKPVFTSESKSYSEIDVSVLPDIFSEVSETNQVDLVLQSRIVHEVESTSTSSDELVVSLKGFSTEVFLSTPLDPSSDANMLFLANNL
ncbi:hypothetical protein [Flavobacterium sp.]|uniref:hypothetical protein n=1 Tax=Flavobacterium sp. TaxID=239 RepID=UPI0037C011FA